MRRSDEFLAGVHHVTTDESRPAAVDRRAGALPYPQTQVDALREAEDTLRSRGE